MTALDGRIRKLEQNRTGAGPPPMWCYETVRALLKPMNLSSLCTLIGIETPPEVELDEDAFESLVSARARELAVKYRSPQEAIRLENEVRQRFRESFAVNELRRELEREHERQTNSETETDQEHEQGDTEAQ